MSHTAPGGSPLNSSPTICPTSVIGLSFEVNAGARRATLDGNLPSKTGKKTLNWAILEEAGKRLGDFGNLGSWERGWPGLGSWALGVGKASAWAAGRGKSMLLRGI
jgi:hypothetical protein